MGETRHVVIVGGGFAGLGCALRLARNADLHVTLIDKHNYHQFQPLLYQVATGEAAASEVATGLRRWFRRRTNMDVKLGEVTAVDPTARRVTLASGQTVQGDFLVLAAGSQPNFFHTPGAEHSYPLYSLEDAQRLRSRILALFEAADRDPSLLDRGALNFLIVGAGPTGVETAGALADLINKVMPYEYRDLAVQQARVILVELTGTVLPPYTEKSRTYAAEVLQRRGVELRLNTSVEEIHTDRVLLSDGTTIPTQCVIWSGGLKAAPLAASTGLTQGRAGGSTSSRTCGSRATRGCTRWGTSPTCRQGTERRSCRSWRRRRSRRGGGRPATSGGSSTASGQGGSSTSTRGSWR
jgi:NADH:ubiquinone reductase (H+-translocating)